MKKFLSAIKRIPLKVGIALIAMLLTAISLFAQPCDPSTPSFTVNLTGNPSGAWISPSIQRSGLCCTASGSDVCIEFNVTLDPLSTGINFNIVSGAVPPGALYYQVNCGTPVPIGQPICLSGVGPHRVTFCKPGNNPNSYSITSIPAPFLNAQGSSFASPTCPGVMSELGLNKPTVTWTSIPPNAQYNSFLNCTSGCDSVFVTPQGAFPAYVDYQVCGTPYGNCTSGFLCDTVRMYLINDLTVAISPQNITLCNGAGNTTTLTANPSGGIPPYNYLWSNGQTTQSVLVGSGTYTVTLTDSAGCSTATGTATFNSVAPIVADAGNDLVVCANQPSVQLNGSVQVATGGVWTGGNGTFNPNNVTLNTSYTPTSTEIASGFVKLILTTTGNQGCPADADTMRITIVQMPSPSISGTTMLCAQSNSTYSVSLIPGDSYSWSVAGGTVNGSTTSNVVNVTWGSGGTASVTVTQTNSYGCSTSATMNVTVVAQPSPIIIGNSSVCQYNTEAYSVNTAPGSTYSWSVTGGIVIGNTTSNTLNVKWNNCGNASISVTETNSFSCSQSYTLPVVILVRPVPAVSGSNIGCINNIPAAYSSPWIANTNFIWNVSGGTIMGYNGPNSISVLWNSSGNNAVTLRVINTVTGCDSTLVFNVNIGALATPVVQPSTASGCPPLTVAFTGNNPASGQTYSWTFGDVLYSSSANPTHVYNVSGFFNVILITSNATGCSDTATGVVNVYNVPDASFTHNFNDDIYYVDESTLIITNTSSGGNQYTWKFGTGDSSNTFEPPYVYHTAGDYLIRLYVANNWGCIDIAQRPIRVRARENVFVPNAFSPNGDEVNDYFSIGAQNIASINVVIFNRWGEVYYSSNDIKFRWDGTYKGNPVQQGIYGYCITAKGQNGNDYTYNGTVTLVK